MTKENAQSAKSVRSAKHGKGAEGIGSVEGAKSARAPRSGAAAPVGVLDELLGEHHYLGRMLKVLEDQVALISVGEKPDARIMSDVMHYVTNFPDRYHHAKEDLVYEKLMLRDPAARAAVRHEMQAKRRIVADSQSLFDLLEDYRAGHAEVEPEQVRLRVLAYIKELRRHMEAEELKIYPRAHKALRKADWREVDERVKTVIDPVFGAEVAENYQALHDHYVESVKEVEIGKLRARFEETVILIESASALVAGVKRIRARIGEHNQDAKRRNREFGRELLKMKNLSSAREGLSTLRETNREMRAALEGDVKSLWKGTSEAARRPFQYLSKESSPLLRWLARPPQD